MSSRSNQQEVFLSNHTSPDLDESGLRNHTNPDSIMSPDQAIILGKNFLRQTTKRLPGFTFQLSLT